MNLSLTTMGTASAMPISDRNPSAQMLSANGRLFLIDCAEGTQQQIRKAHLSFAKIEAIFISHTHGDHVFGLFGLLNTLAMFGRENVLHIYGPQPLGNMLAFYRNYFGDGMTYEIEYHPLSMKEPEIIHTSKAITVSAFPLQHRIECYGFRFDEIVSERHLQANPDYQPKSYAYCSDTMPFPELPQWIKGVRCVFHEATYMSEMKQKAHERFHSTTDEAARCALEAGAERLIVGHYSARIKDFDAFLKECTDVFPATELGEDLKVFNF